jgi:hypothetical protein
MRGHFWAAFESSLKQKEEKEEKFDEQAQFAYGADLPPIIFLNYPAATPESMVPAGRRIHEPLYQVFSR